MSKNSRQRQVLQEIAGIPSYSGNDVALHVDAPAVPRTVRSSHGNHQPVEKEEEEEEAAPLVEDMMYYRA